MRKAGTKLLISERALRDIAEIEEYSVAQWGRTRLPSTSRTLKWPSCACRRSPNCCGRKKLFIHGFRFTGSTSTCSCATSNRRPSSLTVIHASRDIPSRLAELEPTLAAEVELLHRKLREVKKR